MVKTILRKRRDLAKYLGWRYREAVWLIPERNEAECGGVRAD